MTKCSKVERNVAVNVMTKPGENTDESHHCLWQYLHARDNNDRH